MKKTKKEELPITINLKLAGQDKSVQTDSILSFLRSLKVEPEKIKSRAILEVTSHKGTYRKVFTIIQFKRLLVNDIMKQIISKQLTQAVGLIFNENG